MNPEQFVIEVMRRKVGDDPSIFIYHVVVTAKPDNATWKETFGTVELLQAYLRGWKASLFMSGYGSLRLEWDIPEGWTSRGGKRWIIGPGLICQGYDLNSEGEVVEAI